MSDFSKKSFSRFSIASDDQGVPVQSVIDLIKDHEYYDDLARLLDVDSIKDEFIGIPGSKKLLSAINAQNQKFRKFDVPCKFSDLNFSFDSTNSKEFQIQFNEVDDTVKEIAGASSFVAKPIYSSRSDFFESNFKMDKYANALINDGYSEIVATNLELIREIYNRRSPKAKFYRILKDDFGKFYLRGIVSNMYNDYSNNITVFLGLIVLHQDMRSNGTKFSVDRCEYNESFVRVFFAKEGGRIIDKVGHMNYVIELSNDEIKRESLRFSGVCSIRFKSNTGDEESIYLKPRDFKSSLASVRHNLTPKKAIEELVSFSEYVGKEKQMYDDIVKASQVERHDQIRFLILSKVEKIKQNELKKYSKAMSDALNQRVNNIYDLLKLFSKLDLIVEDIDAKEYLRYLLYDALVNRS